MGECNGSYGTRWYHNPETGDVIKCRPENKPEGFTKGRTPNTKCILCYTDTGSKLRKYCAKHKKSVQKKNGKMSKPPNKGKYKISDLEIIDALKKHNMNKTEAMKYLDLTITGFNWKRIKKLANTI